MTGVSPEFYPLEGPETDSVFRWQESPVSIPFLPIPVCGCSG
jgi:hypothetical protein